jgi:hypothetical protein
MKMLCAVVILVLVSFSCGGGSSSDGTSDYILQPGSLSTTTFNTSYNITYGASQSGNYYAVLYKGTTNGTPYVGITLDEDGNPATSFNLKLNYQSSILPSGDITLQEGIDNLAIKINGTNTTISTGDSIKLNFSGPDSNNIITITGNDVDNNEIVINGTVLKITQIKAYVYQ